MTRNLVRVSAAPVSAGSNPTVSVTSITDPAITVNNNQNPEPFRSVPCLSVLQRT